MRDDIRLPLVFSALILLIFSNIFPIAEVASAGNVVQVTFIECLLMSRSGGASSFRFVMVIATILYPLIEMLAMAFVLLRGRPRQTRERCRIMQIMNRFRPWAMIQIYMLGMLISLIHVNLVAAVVPGIALFSLGLLIVLLGALLASNSSDLWR
ncbi:paraquat-inducible protein A [Herbaspirillum camelliae]|uniref:paraquat-inducible protein A n=1 Tax=Herbaspirillum camelliae TaxID=1892903 RepID=UPI000949E72F